MTELSPQPAFAGTTGLQLAACSVSGGQLVCNGIQNQTMLCKATATAPIAAGDALHFLVTVDSFSGPPIKVQHNTRTVLTIGPSDGPNQNGVGTFEVDITATSGSPNLRLTCDANPALAAQHRFSAFSVTGP